MMWPRHILSSAGAALACAAFFIAYAEYIAPRLVPGGIATIVAAVSVLLVLGLVAGFFVDGNLGVKLVCLALVPVAHWLYAGGDPAKPYVTYLVAGIELACLWFGSTIGHYSRRRKPSASRSV
jgi:hypothetical protein